MDGIRGQSATFGSFRLSLKTARSQALEVTGFAREVPQMDQVLTHVNDFVLMHAVRSEQTGDVYIQSSQESVVSSGNFAAIQISTKGMTLVPCAKEAESIRINC